MKRFGHLLFAVYLLVLLRLTVLRTGALTHGLFSGRVNLPPFTAYRQLLSWGSWFHAAYLFFGNIAWFMPLGFYLRWQKKAFWRSLMTGLFLSLLIESLQFTLGCGIFETDDLILNTVGAAFGYMTFPLLRRHK